MNSTSERSRSKVFPRLPSAVIAVLALSACAGTGRFSAAAICERAGGDYVGNTCQHRWTPAELAAKQWCETHGGVYSVGDGCQVGSGGP